MIHHNDTFPPPTTPPAYYRAGGVYISFLKVQYLINANLCDKFWHM